MIKILLVLLFSHCCITMLSGQSRDKQQPNPEMQGLNRLGDSLYKAGLARDSAFKAELEASLKKVRQSIAEKNYGEVEDATQEVMRRHEKEYKARKFRIVLASSAFFITILLAGMIRRKRDKTRSTHQ